jgi:hypothetical protein
MWREIEYVSKAYDQMKETGIEPIILKYGKVLKTANPQDNRVLGLYGFSFMKYTAPSGEVSMRGEVDPRLPVDFYPDEFNIGYAALPTCERNIKVLKSVGMSGPWTVIEPKSLAQEIEVAYKKAEEAKKVEEKKPAKPEFVNPNVKR